MMSYSKSFINNQSIKSLIGFTPLLLLMQLLAIQNHLLTINQ